VSLSEQARLAEARTEERQKQLDETYVRARWASEETLYALSHLRGLGPAPGDSDLRALESWAGSESQVSARTLRDLIERYRMTIDMIDHSEDTLQALGETLQLIPASDWARNLEYRPSGYFEVRPNIMMLRGPGSENEFDRLYDVDAGRFLTEDELPRRR